MAQYRWWKFVVVLLPLLFVQFWFVNCGSSGSSQSVASNDDDNNNNNNNNNNDAACTSSLEAEMSKAFMDVPTTESFYVELRRPSDNRVFRYSRTATGKAAVLESSMLQSASTAKMISAAVILDVISNPSNYPGAGKVGGSTLTLDSPIRNFLPMGSGTAWKTSTGAITNTSRLYSVTLRHLLSFTSGMYAEDDCIISNLDPNQCIVLLVTASASKNTNPSAPRTFYYSGSHLFVAAQAAVNASGLANWAALFKRFKEIHGVFQSPVAGGSLTTDGVGAFYPSALKSPNPAGAMRYSAGDYAPFLQKLVQAQILPQGTLDEMLSDQLTPFNTVIAYSPMQDENEEWHYNLGNWTECLAPSFNASCVVDRVSSPGSFGSYPFIDFNPTGSQDFMYVGFLGYGGTTMGDGKVGVALYRSALGGGVLGKKDLAQKWAASQCL